MEGSQIANETQRGSTFVPKHNEVRHAFHALRVASCELRGPRLKLLARHAVQKDADGVLGDPVAGQIVGAIGVSAQLRPKKYGQISLIWSGELMCPALTLVCKTTKPRNAACSHPSRYAPLASEPAKTSETSDANESEWATFWWETFWWVLLPPWKQWGVHMAVIAKTVLKSHFGW